MGPTLTQVKTASKKVACSTTMAINQQSTVLNNPGNVDTPQNVATPLTAEALSSRDRSHGSVSKHKNTLAWLNSLDKKEDNAVEGSDDMKILLEVDELAAEIENILVYQGSEK